MNRQVQIAPVGYEYDRIIEGAFVHACNIIYLLKSYKPIEDESDPDKDMVTRAEWFVEKLEDHFKQSKICTPIVRKAILIQLEPIIEELCKIIKEEVENYDTKEIWINISTSTKLFASAAMYVGSFMSEIVHLFYIDASHYTVDDLYNPDMSKKEVLERYQTYGITYKKDDKSYKNVDVPVYPTEVLSDPKKQILKNMRKLTEEEREKKVTFKTLLVALEEDPYNKGAKMKFAHHLSNLIERKFMLDEYHGRQRRFQLTQEGQILSLILQYFD